MHSRVVLLGSALLISACSLDRVSITGDPGDAGGEIDAGSVFDAGADGGPIDASVTPDSGLDSGPIPEVDSGVDAGRDSGVDAGQDAGPPPLRTCDEIYGTLGSYRRCAETETSCEIYVQLSNSSCASVCADRGGVCITSHSESGSDSCTPNGGAEPCTSTHNDAICTCTRIP